MVHQAGGRQCAARPENEMADLTLAASRQIALPPHQWAHDIRNLLTTIGLHLDSLARLSGPHGAKAVSATHTLIARAAIMCGEAVTLAEGEAGRARRHPFDITSTVRQVIDLLEPLGPEGFSIDLASEGCHLVLGNHTDVFRIVFNLVHNALSVARAGTRLRRVDISVESEGAITVVHIGDDGGGLPPQVLARLFRAPFEGGAAHGHGLAIARELTERNGGMLTCKSSRRGTAFRLELAACTSIRVAEGPVTRSLGRRAGA
jgi:signal transduction histidine kinase